ncbi:4-hydroxy-tetrahydrodipicolinate reductase [Candidatus Micrarchaeota archaeon]|nr:4-hydroxy-tetrahydrodipicolinate reductase [Candidatus Micrarchaeota archaeon]
MLGISIFGAGGRMGEAITQEILTNYRNKVALISGLESPNSKRIGKNIPGTGIIILSSASLDKALKNVDTTINFTTPEAEIQNIPKIAQAKKDIILGTTGFTSEQMKIIEDSIVKNKVSAVISPNFSPLVNTQMLLTKKASEILAPLGYDVGLIEEHHTGKKDSPSGTAKKLANIIISTKAANKINYRSEGLKAKEKGELDIGVLRLGGTAGQHEVRIVGTHGRLVIESLMYNRADFAKGAIDAALWLQKNRKPGKIFSMEDVLGIK